MNTDIFVIIPAAGFGTRLLPGTKSIPKELFPIINKPAIDYIFEELELSKIKNVILITSKDKDEINDYFDHNKVLEDKLLHKKKIDLYKSITKYLDINISSIRQKNPLGTGHAVLISKNIINNKPFIVSLPDRIIVNGYKYINRMIELYEKYNKCVICLEKVPDELISNYGVVKIDTKNNLDNENNEVILLNGVIEKPKLGEHPSNLAIVGRYIFPPKLMDILKSTKPSANGEIELTNALQILAETEGIIGLIVNDVIHDIGIPMGYLKTTIYYGLKDPLYADGLKDYINNII